MKLSVIIPVYNEEKTLKDFYKVITEELKKIKYELIFVNDGSSDESLRVLKELLNPLFLNLKPPLKI